MQPIQSIQQPIQQQTMQQSMQQLRQSTSQSSIHSSTSYTVIRTQQQQQPQSISRMFTKELQAQSSQSVDLKGDEMVMKLLMMALQIQRKDTVVKNLLKQLQTMQKLTAMHSNTQTYSLKEQLSHTKHYIEQLEYKIQQLTITNNQLVATTRSTLASTSKQMQQRISILQQKNKSLQIVKIQLQSEIQKLTTENKMLNYKIVNVESNEKAKIRDLQNIILQLERKLDQEKKLTNQLKIVIQSSHQELRVVKENQQRIIQQFNQRFVQIQKDISHQQDLKRSQAITVQQKIQMTQQELIRIQEDAKFWRKKTEELQTSFDKKQQDLLSQIRTLKTFQSQALGLRQQISMLQSESQQKSLQLHQLTQQINRSHQRAGQQEQKHSLSFIEIQQTFENQMSRLREDIQSYQRRLIENQSQIQRLKGQNRKLKRQLSTAGSDCPSCKALQSASTIKSSTKLFTNQLSLSQIIQQTQKLRDGAVKIQQILSFKRTNNNGFSMNYGESKMSLQQRSFYQ